MKYLPQKLLTAFIACWALTSAVAESVPVQINPGDYTGLWNIGGVWRTGSAQVNLEPGQHYCNIAYYDNILLSVQADGAVSIYNGVGFGPSSASATASGSTVQFATKEVLVDPGEYQGLWSISYGSSWHKDARSLHLVAGLQYQCRIGYYDGIFIKVAAGGSTAVHDGATFGPQSISAIASGSTIEFLTTPVLVNPADYPGFWDIAYASDRLQGAQTLQLVRGLHYTCTIAYYDGFLFSLDSNGNVAVYDGADFSSISTSATASGQTLTFHAVSAIIDPGSYPGEWEVAYGTTWDIGVRSVQLVPGITYLVQPRGGGGGFLEVLGPCDFSPAVLSTSAGIFTIDCAELDTTAPVITLYGQNHLQIECGSPFLDPGAEAIDDVDGTVPVTIAGIVDVHTLGTYTIQYRASDSSGNESVTIRTVHVADTTPPEISGVQSLTLSCSIDLLVPVSSPALTVVDACDPAPVLSYSINPADGFPVGVTTVLCTATDQSGNTSTASFTVTRAALAFDGFLAPIGGADASGGSFAQPLRTFKANQTLPVKFTASCDGVAVTTGVHRLQANKHSDQTTSDTPIEVNAQDAATTGNEFRLSGAEWHFNLDLSATGIDIGIWQLTATLSDGSQHHVWIQIK